MATAKLILGIARPEQNSASKSQKQSRAGSSGSAAFSQSKKLTPEIRQKIFERDNFTCHYCGFQAKKYQEIHHLDNNLANHAEKNLATTCLFCHQCFNLETVTAMKSGALVWLPEIEQADLHHIARAIYVARISQGPIADAARKAYDMLMSRREDAKKRLGTDNPQILATVLKDYLGPAHYAARQKKLAGIKLLPIDRRIVKEADLEFNQFPQILAYWRSKDGPFGGKSPPQWTAIYQQILQAA